MNRLQSAANGFFSIKRSTRDRSHKTNDVDDRNGKIRFGRYVLTTAVGRAAVRRPVPGTTGRNNNWKSSKRTGSMWKDGAEHSEN